MIDLEKLIAAREHARDVLSGHTRSHVVAARVLAEFVMTLDIPIVHAPDCALEQDAGEPGARGLPCSCGANDAKA